MTYIMNGLGRIGEMKIETIYEFLVHLITFLLCCVFSVAKNFCGLEVSWWYILVFIGLDILFFSEVVELKRNK